MEQQMPTAEAKSREEEEQVLLREKYLQSNRRGKRSMLRHVSRGRNGTARIPSRVRTGSPKHFTFWMADLGIKSALQRLKTNRLADSQEDVTMGSGYALLFVGGFRSVWDVSRAEVGALLKVPGMTPDYLDALESDLRNRRVPLVWTVR